MIFFCLNRNTLLHLLANMNALVNMMVLCRLNEAPPMVFDVECKNVTLLNAYIII